MKNSTVRDLLAINLKRFREQRNWSQARLAEEVDVALGTIARMEIKKLWASPEMLDRIASALSIELWQLFIDPDKKPEPTALEILNIVGRALDVAQNAKFPRATALPKEVEELWNKAPSGRRDLAREILGGASRGPMNQRLIKKIKNLSTR